MADDGFRPTSVAPYWFGGIFAGAGLMFMSVGVVLAVTQHYRLLTYQPVPARVLSSDVVTHSGSKSARPLRKRVLTDNIISIHCLVVKSMFVHKFSRLGFHAAGLLKSCRMPYVCHEILT
jgi:hypothetical protein